MIAEADIRKMSKKERLDTIELIRSTLDDEDIETPEWHYEVLEKRMRDIEAGKETFFPVEELTKRLDALRHARANH